MRQSQSPKKWKKSKANRLGLIIPITKATTTTNHSHSGSVGQGLSYSPALRLGGEERGEAHHGGRLGHGVNRNTPMDTVWSLTAPTTLHFVVTTTLCA